MQFIGDNRKKKVTVLRLRVKVELLVITAVVYFVWERICPACREMNRIFISLSTGI